MVIHINNKVLVGGLSALAVMSYFMIQPESTEKSTEESTEDSLSSAPLLIEKEHKDFNHELRPIEKAVVTSPILNTADNNVSAANPTIAANLQDVDDLKPESSQAIATDDGEEEWVRDALDDQDHIAMQQEQINAEIAVVESSFFSEDIDEEWSESIYTQVNHFMDNEDTESTLFEEMECHSSICKFTLDTTDPQNSALFFDRFRFQFADVLNAGMVKQEDGKMVIYMAQNYEAFGL